MKKTNIIFWISTGIIFLFEGLMPALTSQSEMAKEGISHLGYPAYFGVMLAVFKVVGAPIKNIDDYLLYLPEKQRLVLEEVRQVIRETAPQAEEVISYGMPAFKYHGALVYFGAFKNHCSFFSGNATLLAKMYPELKAYKTSKGTLQFTPENPLPRDLIKKIVLERMMENEEKMATKKTTKY